MDKQTAEPKPKKQEEILSFCGVAISVKYAEQDDPHITETLKRSVFSYGFYNVLIGLTQLGAKSCKSPKYRTAEVLQ